MPISTPAFDRQMERLLDYFHPGAPKDRYLGLVDEWERRVKPSERMDDAIFAAAVTEVIDHFKKWPTLDEMRQVVEAVRPDFVRDVPVLPAPRANVADEIDPSDPYSCTPEERERWAREDAWIRTWASRRRQTPPELLARLSEEEREKALAADAANEAIARWPQLRPDQRRAKDARTERARLAAIQGLRAAGNDFAAALLERIPPTYDRNTSLGGPAA